VFAIDPGGAMETVFERVSALDVHKAQVTDRCGSDAPGAVSALTFESALARIWIEPMGPFE
jgi:hypothetical protein